MKAEGVIDNDISGKTSRTQYKVLESLDSERFQCLNKVQLIPETGRRHQLRIHLSSIGNPILGDTTYGKEGSILKGKGLFLCASSLEFIHPILNEAIFLEIKLPGKYNKIFPQQIP